MMYVGPVVCIALGIAGAWMVNQGLLAYGRHLDRQNRRRPSCPTCHRRLSH